MRLQQPHRLPATRVTRSAAAFVPQLPFVPPQPDPAMEEALNALVESLGPLGVPLGQ